jgi:hypothetical protein
MPSPLSGFCGKHYLRKRHAAVDLLHSRGCGKLYYFSTWDQRTGILDEWTKVTTSMMTYTAPLPGLVDTSAPLIYMWEIYNSAGEVTGRYIGKANGGERRPTKHYSRNVNKLLSGKAYRPNQPFRQVHIALAWATCESQEIRLSFLCNVSATENIFDVERHYIRTFGCDRDDGIGLNGPGKRIALPPSALALPEGNFVRPAPCVSATTSGRAVTPVNAEDDGGADLEDFVEFIELYYPDKFKIIPGVRRYALFIGSERILRAAQSGPAGAVKIKQAQSSRTPNAKVEFRWNGSDEQLRSAIECELQVFATRLNA